MGEDNIPWPHHLHLLESSLIDKIKKSGDNFHHKQVTGTIPLSAYIILPVY